MHKVKKSSELLWVMGILFVSFGVAICSKAGLGVSMIAAPPFVIFDAVEKLWSGFSVGMIEYLVQGVLLILMCLAVRRFDWKYLLSFAVAVIYGYSIDFALWVLSDLSFDTVLMRWIMLIVGDTLTAFGVACFFRTYMPLQVYELFVAELSSRYKLNITRVKLFFDLALLVLSVTLALTLFDDKASFDWSKIYYQCYHNIGLGTIVTAFINAPIIAASGKLIDKIFEPTPLIGKLHSAIGIK